MLLPKARLVKLRPASRQHGHVANYDRLAPVPQQNCWRGLGVRPPPSSAGQSDMAAIRSHHSASIDQRSRPYCFSQHGGSPEPVPPWMRPPASSRARGAPSGGTPAGVPSTAATSRLLGGTPQTL